MSVERWVAANSTSSNPEHSSLPGNSDKLIRAVLAKTPDAIIVIQSGTPTTMDWADEASTVVQVSLRRAA